MIASACKTVEVPRATAVSVGAKLPELPADTELPARAGEANHLDRTLSERYSHWRNQAPGHPYTLYSMISTSDSPCVSKVKCPSPASLAESRASIAHHRTNPFRFGRRTANFRPQFTIIL